MSQDFVNNLTGMKLDTSNQCLQPIVTQPGGFVAPPQMRLESPAPMQMAGYIPTGLEYLGVEYLDQIDSLFIKQKIELLEAFTGWETENRYSIKNSAGQPIFYASEQSECCNRCCWGKHREFDMKITNFSGQEIIGLQRPLNCQGFCCPCCLQSLNVALPTGNPIGSIEEKWSFCDNILAVKDSSGQKIYDIKGPNKCTLNFCPPTCCGNDIVFEISNTGDQACVGFIIKKWSGFAKEVFTDADNFQIIFPSNANVQKKALLIGAAFLVDFMYFEDNSGAGDN